MLSSPFSRALPLIFIVSSSCWRSVEVGIYLIPHPFSLKFLVLSLTTNPNSKSTNQNPSLFTLPLNDSDNEEGYIFAHKSLYTLPEIIRVCMSIVFKEIILINPQALQMGIWSVWLTGILLIGVSFYATHRLPWSISDQIHNSMPFPYGLGGGDLGNTTITIFTAPRPFNGSVGERQVLAIRSWLGLSSDVTVVLFSRDPSVVSFAGGLESRVSVETNIDFT
ncbi:hypothetical protein U1Q18_043356 [Sarracenia purpurea var. burkii]